MAAQVTTLNEVHITVPHRISFAVMQKVLVRFMMLQRWFQSLKAGAPSGNLLYRNAYAYNPIRSGRGCSYE
jgi:hypothetical protein